MAAQDVRFARTIERIQRIMVSELTKIAIIHLYVQGFTDEDLIDFELEMSSPSVIFEQEKLNLWKEKVQLAKDITDSKYLSRDWVYHNILNVSLDQARDEEDKILKDVEWVSKVDTAAQPQQPPMGPEAGAEPGTEPAPEGGPEGEEPQKLDTVDAVLASLEEPTEEESDLGEEELEEAKMGRPRTGVSYGQDSHPRGRDPLGHKENMDTLKGRTPRRAPSRKSPLSLENHEISSLIKQLNATKTTSILNEENILDIEN